MSTTTNNQSIIINNDLCMSIKNKKTYTQCQYKKKCGDFCLVHNKTKNVIRIDTYLNNIQKKKKIKENINNGKKNINIDNTNINDVIKIQKYIRNRYLSKISGPGYNNPLLCNNNRDVISLENIWIDKNNTKIINLDFDKNLLFTYKYKNLIHGYNIESLDQLFNKNIYIDPIINKKFNKKTILAIKNKIKFLNKITNNKDINSIRLKDVVYNKIISIIKILENNNIYLDVKYLKDIPKVKFYKLYIELKNIFENYKYTHNDIYKKIIKKNYFTCNNYDLKQFNNLKLQDLIFSIILDILNTKKENNYQSMTCYLILYGLCLVSKDIHTTYPNMLLI